MSKARAAVEYYRRELHAQLEAAERVTDPVAREQHRRQADELHTLLLAAVEAADNEPETATGAAHNASVRIS